MGAFDRSPAHAWVPSAEFPVEAGSRLQSETSGWTAYQATTGVPTFPNFSTLAFFAPGSASALALGPSWLMRQPMVAAQTDNDSPFERTFLSVEPDGEDLKVRFEYRSKKSNMWSFTGTVRIQNSTPTGVRVLPHTRLFANTAVLTVNRLMPKIEASLLRLNFGAKFLGLNWRTEVDTGRTGAEGSRFQTDVASISGIVEGDVTPWICNKDERAVRILVYGEAKVRVGVDQVAHVFRADPSALKSKLLPSQTEALVQRFIRLYSTNVWLRLALAGFRWFPLLNLGLTGIDLYLLVSALQTLSVEANASPFTSPPASEVASTMTTSTEAPAKASNQDEVLPPEYLQALETARQFLQKPNKTDRDYQLAAEQLLHAARLQVDEAEPHIGLARVHIAKHRTNDALTESDLALALARKTQLSRAHNTKGRAELQRGAYDAAIASFKAATESDRNNIWAWNNIGYAEILRKNYAAAVEPLMKATRSKSATGYMFSNLGVALEQIGRLDEAKVAFAKGGELKQEEAIASGEHRLVRRRRPFNNGDPRTVAKREQRNEDIQLGSGGAGRRHENPSELESLDPNFDKASSNMQPHLSGGGSPGAAVSPPSGDKVDAISGSGRGSMEQDRSGQASGSLASIRALVPVPSDSDRRDNLSAEEANRRWNLEHPNGRTPHAAVQVPERTPPRLSNQGGAGASGQREERSPSQSLSAGSATNIVVAPSDGDRHDNLSAEEANRRWDLTHPKKHLKSAAERHDFEPNTAGKMAFGPCTDSALRCAEQAQARYEETTSKNGSNIFSILWRASFRPMGSP